LAEIVEDADDNLFSQVLYNNKSSYPVQIQEHTILDKELITEH